MSRAFRIIKTGFAFALFGLGGLAIGLVILPSVYLFSSKQHLPRRSRAAIAWCFRTLLYIARFLQLVTYDIGALREIRGPGLLVANHPSLIDIVFLAGWIKNANCVVKASLLRNPFTAGPIYSAGYIHSQAPDLTDKICNALADGEVIVLFPEGTRSIPGQPLKFRRGAAHLALQTNSAIQLVSIQVTPSILTKEESWWQVPVATPHFAIQVHDPWSMQDYSATGLPSQQARRLTRDMQRYLGQQLSP